MSDNRNNIKSGLNADLRSIDSIYRMIVVAGLRSKQLVRGARPKILPDPNCRRNISIALEEARRGLLHFTAKKKVETADLLVKASVPAETRETIA
jgi:DNA-directed RNA polymerase subunit K/omega